MDGQRFDDLTRSGASRRRLLTRITAVPLALLATFPVRGVPTG